MNQNPNAELQSATEEVALSVPAAVEIKDLEPQKDVSGGMKCQNNLKQLGLG